jgi:HK97 family phage major capsid protein
MDGFRAYLRTGQPNNDLTRSNAQTTGTGSSGGFTVPEEFMQRMVDVIKSFGGVMRNVEVITTQDGRVLPFPSIDDTANTAAQAAENVAPASAGADLVFGEVSLGAYEFNATGAGNTPLAVPRALTQDSAFDIEGLVATKLGQRIGRKMAAEAVNGTNATTPQGILQGITGLELAQSSGVKYSDLVDLVM